MTDERDTRDTSIRTFMQRLYEARGIVPSQSTFRCPSLSVCSRNTRRPLITGNWVFVGCDYGSARVEGMPAKILFVAMDRGGYRFSDTEEFADTQQSFRSSIENPRNPHMGGVSLILRQLVDEKRISVVSGQCALTNTLKCAQETGKMSTNASQDMIKQCAHHLHAEIGVWAASARKYTVAYCTNN